MTLISKNANKAEVVEVPIVYGVPKYGFKLLPIVNASNEELQKMGLYPNTDESGQIVEPSYVRPKLDNDKNPVGHNLCQIELYAKLVNATAEGFPALEKQVFRFSLYIEDTHQNLSSTGKYLYVNDLGETVWATDEDNVSLSYYCNSTNVKRVAYVGEKDFLSNIHIIAGLANGIYIDNIDSIFDGDFSIIRTLVREINAQKGYNGFKALLTVGKSGRGNPFQSMYTKSFDLVESTTNSKIKKELKNSESRGFPYKYSYGGKVTNGLIEVKDDFFKADEVKEAHSAFDPYSDELPF